MYVKRLVVPVTTDASGAASGRTDNVNGRVIAVRYVPDGTAPLDTGADVTLAGETSGIAIVTLTNIGTSAITKMPRGATCDTSGAAALYAAGGAAVNAPIPVADEAIAVAVAQGGDTKSGTFHIFLEGLAQG